MKEILPIILYILLIILVIVLIVFIIRMFKTLNKVDKVVDDVNEKVNKLDGVFNIIDATADGLSTISDKFVNFLTTKLFGLFRSKKKKGDDSDE